MHRALRKNSLKNNYQISKLGVYYPKLKGDPEIPVQDSTIYAGVQKDVATGPGCEALMAG